MPHFGATIDISPLLTTPQARFAGQLPLHRGALLANTQLVTGHWPLATYKVNGLAGV